MPKIDFYVITAHEPDARLRFACRLIEKAYKQRHRIYIHVDSQANAHALDELLWTYRDDSFLPHNLYGEGQEPAPPIQIGYDTSPDKQCDILINLHADVPAFFQQFQRVLEIVSPDETLQAIARSHYRHYRAQNLMIATHRLDDVPPQ